MREIKFRIYFKDEEPFMSEPITLTELLHEDWIEFGDEKGEWSLPLKDFRFFYRKNEKYEVMQYTGLKDKNGKEIYEGDIIRTNFGKDFLVKWIKRLASFCYVEIVKDSGGKCFLSKELQAGSYEVEIIGNLYENPELLEIQN